MERNMKRKDLGTKMAEDEFKLEFAKRRFSNEPYENGQFGRWPIAIRIKLGETYLGEPIGDKKSQPVGDYFEPADMVDRGIWILGGVIKPYLRVGHEGHVSIEFNYPFPEKVEVSLDKKDIGANLAFDPSSVHSVVLDSEKAAFEFFNYHNDLFKDVLECQDSITIEMLATAQNKMTKDPKVSDLFRKYGIGLTKVPEKFLE